MKKVFKKLTGIALTATLCLSFAIPTFAKTTEVLDNNVENWVTLSIDEFMAIAENSGVQVVYEDDYTPPRTRMQNNFTVELTNNNFKTVSSDLNLLNERAKVKAVTISSNITSIDVKFQENHTNLSYTATGLKAGDWTDIFSVTALNGYNVSVKANTSGKSELSSTNKGTVTIYWSDGF